MKRYYIALILLTVVIAGLAACFFPYKEKEDA